MKKIIFLSYICLLPACNKGPVRDPVPFRYEIVTIEDCEYIQYKGIQGYRHITHKGNCRNPIHHNTR